jgi:hypothetical protein
MRSPTAEAEYLGLMADLGHPGIKSAMIEDLIMEFDDVPEGTVETLANRRAAQGRNHCGSRRDL